MGVTLITYFAIAIGIGIFSYGFLSTTSLAVAHKAAEKSDIIVGDLHGDELLYWIEAPSVLGAIVVTISILLFMLQEKFSYIVSINKSIQSLEGGNLSERVEILGDDELSDLAESINSMAESIEANIKNEEILRRKNAEIVSSLSHDIRTPLTAIISYIDFIKDDKCEDVEKQSRYLDIIQSKAYQIKAMTDELFEQSYKMNDSDNTNGKEIIDCGLLLIQLMDEKEDELENEGFSVNVEIEEMKSFKMKMNINDMCRIFDNICSNIVKYGNRNKAVGFKISNKEDILEIYQSNSIGESDKLIESHGVGIKSCKKIIESYNGAIEIKSCGKIFELKIIIPL